MLLLAPAVPTRHGRAAAEPETVYQTFGCEAPNEYCRVVSAVVNRNILRHFEIGLPCRRYYP